MARLFLLAGQAEPAGWFTTPPDLRSRLTAMPVARIEAPDDATLAARLREECALRHLILPEESINYLAQRMEPSWEAVTRVADEIARTPGQGEKACGPPARRLSPSAWIRAEFPIPDRKSSVISMV